MGGRTGLWTIAIDCIPHFALSSLDASQCFPFYVYDEDGSNRRENITDWALAQFRERYGRASQRERDVEEPSPPSSLPQSRERGEKKKTRRAHAATLAKSAERKTRRADAATLAKEIGKWDIFYYVYGVLHHPGYRTKFADNLKRELPRIPFAPDFWAFADAGRELARLHLDYEKLEPYELEYVWADRTLARASGSKPITYKVEKMKLTKDKTALIVNPSLTLTGIPPEVFDYRLGNRSALEWVIDQYRVTEDARSGIRSDPNRADDPEYIVRLVGQVVKVSVETVKIVRGLPEKYAD